MDNRYRLAVVVDGVFDGGPDQPLRAAPGDRFDSDARVFREADVFHAHLLLQEADHLGRLLRLGRPFDAGVNVFRVFAENNHIDLVGMPDGRGNTVEPFHRPLTDIEVQLLPQRDVQAAASAPDRCRKRSLDGDAVFADCFECFIRKPGVFSIDRIGLFAGIDLHPLDLPLPAVGLFDRRIDHLLHRGRDFGADTVAFDKRDNRMIRHIEMAILQHGDPAARRWNLDLIVAHMNIPGDACFNCLWNKSDILMDVKRNGVCILPQNFFARRSRRWTQIIPNISII